MNRFQRRLNHWFYQRTLPSQAELVRALVSGVAHLELKADEYRFLAPIPDQIFGPVIVSGSSLPVFHYTVFDSELMDFIRIRTEVALPDQIRLISKLIPSEGEPGLQDVPMKPFYAEPFYTLARSLYHYFPLLPEAAKELPSYEEKTTEEAQKALRTEDQRTPFSPPGDRWELFNFKGEQNTH